MAQSKLTLSQRRALLHLLDYAPFVVDSKQTRAAYDHHVDVGYATLADDGYRLTDAGRARAQTVNPGYRDWTPGGSVVAPQLPDVAWA